MDPETAAAHSYRYAQLYFGRGCSSTAPETRINITPRRGPIAISTAPDERTRNGILHEIDFDPDALSRAWSFVQAPALGDAILLEAEPVDVECELGPVFRYRGVRKTQDRSTSRHSVRLKIVEGCVVRIGSFPGTRVCGPTPETAIARAHRVVEAGGTIDWSAADLDVEIQGVTDVSVCRPLSDRGAVVIELAGMQRFESRWTQRRSIVRPGSTEPVDVYKHAVLTRPSSVRVIQAPDGRWIEYDCAALLRYERAKEKAAREAEDELRRQGVFEAIRAGRL